MKFALFAGDHYYPEGGWRDCVGVYATVEDAREAYLRGRVWNDDDQFGDHPFEWGHIIDLHTQEMVDTLRG